MVAYASTIAILGLEARTVEVQVQISSGLHTFTVVGLPDKAINESRERVRAALASIGLSLPPKRITINLSPADLPKEGSHYDLPIALGLLTAMNLIDQEELANYVAVGELGLDGRVTAIPGVLLAALHASAMGKGLICPVEQGCEAAWAGDIDILASPDLVSLLNHMKGQQLLPPPLAMQQSEQEWHGTDLAEIKGQEGAKRALEIAAAGSHNLLMVGPPGAGKSLLASCLPNILPPLTSEEALEVSMIASVMGGLPQGHLTHMRPYRAPHHSTSTAALVGGGHRSRPGEISLAHRGVLFLDELPEFQRVVLDSLRQPIELGSVSIARANMTVTYPARFQLIAAMNPCRCGHLADAQACSRAPRCAFDYQAKVSGPMLDRIDIRIEVPALSVGDMAQDQQREASHIVAGRVRHARDIQKQRYKDHGIHTNAEVNGKLLEDICVIDTQDRQFLIRAAEKMHITARGYHRILRVARTIADLAVSERIAHEHLAEAIHYRRQIPTISSPL